MESNQDIIIRPCISGQQPEDIIHKFDSTTYGWNNIPFPCVVGDTVEEASQAFDYDKDTLKSLCKLSWRAFDILKGKRIWDRNKPKFWRFLTHDEQLELIKVWQKDM